MVGCRLLDVCCWLLVVVIVVSWLFVVGCWLLYVVYCVLLFVVRCWWFVICWCLVLFLFNGLAVFVECCVCVRCLLLVVLSFVVLRVLCVDGCVFFLSV